MFEYILAGFTGSFFSYFCVYLFGAVTEGIAKDSLSTRVVRKLNMERMEIMEKLEGMERILAIIMKDELSRRIVR